MQKHPTVVGLKVCHEAIVEERSRNVTLVNCFRGLSFAAFPATARPFVACVVLTDGCGHGKLSLRIIEPENLNEIWVDSWDIRLKDPLKEIWFLLPVAECVFDQPGRYQVSAWLDGELMATTMVRIRQKGE